MKPLKERYHKICLEYCTIFANKQGFEEWSFIRGASGHGIGYFLAADGDFAFDVQDVIYDIDSDQPKRFIFRYLDFCLSLFPKKVIRFVEYAEAITEGKTEKEIKNLFS